MLRDFSSAAQEYTSRIGLRSKLSRKKSYSLLTPDHHILQILFFFFSFFFFFFFFWFDHVLSCVWLFATAGTVACQAPLPMKFSRQKYWSASLFSNPGDLPKLEYPMSPAVAGRFFFLTTAPSGKHILKSLVFKNGRVEVEPGVHFTCNMMPGYWITLSQMNTFEKFSNFKRPELSPPCLNIFFLVSAPASTTWYRDAHR